MCVRSDDWETMKQLILNGDILIYKRTKSRYGYQLIETILY